VEREQCAQVNGLAVGIAGPGRGERPQPRAAQAPPQPSRRVAQREADRQPAGPARVVAQLPPGEAGRINDYFGSVPRRLKHGGRA
jgi:hypothetical protein